MVLEISKKPHTYVVKPEKVNETLEKIDFIKTNEYQTERSDTVKKMVGSYFNKNRPTTEEIIHYREIRISMRKSVINPDTHQKNLLREIKKLIQKEGIKIEALEMAHFLGITYQKTYPEQLIEYVLGFFGKRVDAKNPQSFRYCALEDINADIEKTMICPSLKKNYGEKPTISFESLYDICKEAKKSKMVLTILVKEILQEPCQIEANDFYKGSIQMKKEMESYLGHSPNRGIGIGIRTASM